MVRYQRIDIISSLSFFGNSYYDIDICIVLNQDSSHNLCTEFHTFHIFYYRVHVCI